ncbi:hypothetical protein Mgra_00001569 [Meloidogyne graminicola]|uniref:Uncharacterized protein n=1 Tax=Meloidogyne graminicola TaxID=189291 RepID=A0A8T0A0I5_9BILA|nr:hypothetical protein Mgra_00001569 [Meloidogyne graminicola]
MIIKYLLIILLLIIKIYFCKNQNDEIEEINNELTTQQFLIKNKEQFNNCFENLNGLTIGQLEVDLIEILNKSEFDIALPICTYNNNYNKNFDEIIKYINIEYSDIKDKKIIKLSENLQINKIKLIICEINLKEIEINNLIKWKPNDEEFIEFRTIINLNLKFNKIIKINEKGLINKKLIKFPNYILKII